MAKTSINYLFPPDQIERLPTWRFVLHFKVPAELRDGALRAAVEGLKGVEWKTIEFPFGLDSLSLDPTTGTVSVPIEVPEGRRCQPRSLAHYESEMWKICGHLAAAGLGDVYYEAIDWQGP
jgi:hypothetical protein